MRASLPFVSTGLLLVLGACATTITDKGDSTRSDAGKDAAADGLYATDATAWPDAGATDAEPDGPTLDAPPKPDAASDGGAVGSDANDAGAVDGATTCKAPVTGPCDTLPQCGCGAGKACDVTSSTGKTTCVNAGAAAVYETCSAFGQCTAGTSCVGGSCKPFCNDVGDCVGAHRECTDVSSTTPDGGSSVIPEFRVCTAGCDLLHPDAVCGPGVACILTTTAGPGTDCYGGGGTGTGPGGCSSADPSTCAPGYICLTDDSCAAWCRVGFSDCAPGSSCGTLVTPPTIDGVEYGVCQ